jgi:integrase/recombinase XerD
MARKAEAALYQLVEKGNRYKQAPVVKAGNGRWVPKITEPFVPKDFYLRYTLGGKRKWENVGPDITVALSEQRARQAMLDNVKREEPETRKSLAKAITAYLFEVRTKRGEKAEKRAKWLLELFATVTKKQFVDEITRDTMIHFMAYLKDNGKSPKTQRDRISSIETFLGRKLMTKGDLPKVTKKIVDCYTEEEVNKMLAVATPDERFLIQFLLATGVREQEAAHTVWRDIKWNGKVLRVSAKPDCRCPYCGADGFNIKDHEEREIPLPDWFMPVLKARKQAATRDLLFYNSNGNPEGHFLYSIYRLAARAGVTKANCHKFRRTFATWNHVLGGVSIAVLQKWLGHSDVETTMRYISTTEIRSGHVRESVEKTWEGFQTKPRLAVVA